MGAVTFSIDLGMVTALKKVLPLDIFVETGTFRGDTVELVRDRFSKIYSVELSPEHYEAARVRFSDQGHINLVYGDSAKALLKWVPSLREKSVLYFLDAHYCKADNTAGEASRCPLPDEIRAIGPLNSESVIAIDDARLFLAPPPPPYEISNWPDLNAVLGALRAASPLHHIMVLNDNILFFPPSAGASLREYAQHSGVDWLALMSKIRDYDNLRAQFNSTIVQLSDKESLIVQLQAICGKYGRQKARIRHSILGRMQQAWYNLHKFPKIGRLRHHAPIPMQSFGLPPAPDYSRRRYWQSISIVTPSYCQSRFIGKTIDSILMQNYPNLEYFIQDGGSTDGTLNILKLYSERLTGWESTPDGGQSQAINRGFGKTNGEIMAWLNSDDVLLPGSLAYVADYFERHQEVDVVYSHRILIDEHDEQIGSWILPNHDDEILSWVDYIPQETLFWRRKIWEKAGGHIDEAFRFAMDWDLLLRFRKAGARMVRLPIFLGAFRIHNSQKTSSVINEEGFEEMNRLRNRELGRIVSKKEIRWKILPYLVAHVYEDLQFRFRRRFVK